MFRLPLWRYLLSDKPEPIDYVAPESLLLLTLMSLVLLIALGTIFLFRNRPLQKRLCLLGLATSSGVLALEVARVEELRKSMTPVSGLWQIGALMPMLMIVFFVLAYAGIRKDEATIRSLDRLR